MAKKKNKSKLLEKPSKSKKKRLKIVLPKKKVVTDLLQVEDIHAIINFVQLERKSKRFKVCFEDAEVVSNILKDAEVVVNRTQQENAVKFSISPGARIEEGSHAKDSLEKLEEFDDENVADGQCY